MTHIRSFDKGGETHSTTRSHVSSHVPRFVADVFVRIGCALCVLGCPFRWFIVQTCQQEVSPSLGPRSTFKLYTTSFLGELYNLREGHRYHHIGPCWSVRTESTQLSLRSTGYAETEGSACEMPPAPAPAQLAPPAPPCQDHAFSRFVTASFKKRSAELLPVSGKGTACSCYGCRFANQSCLLHMRNTRFSFMWNDRRCFTANVEGVSSGRERIPGTSKSPWQG